MVCSLPALDFDTFTFEVNLKTGTTGTSSLLCLSGSRNERDDRTV